MAPPRSDAHKLLVSTVGRLMEKFGPGYWRDLDAQEAYPEAFVSAFETQGFGSLLIPEAHGGTGGTLTDADHRLLATWAASIPATRATMALTER